MPSIEEPGLSELKEKLSEEESAYAQLLAELDSLADAHLPYQEDPEIPAALSKLNDHWEVDPTKSAEASLPGGLKGLLRRTVRRLLEPELAPLQEALTRQQAFNSFTVQFLNRYMAAGTASRGAPARVFFDADPLCTTHRSSRRRQGPPLRAARQHEERPVARRNGQTDREHEPRIEAGAGKAGVDDVERRPGADRASIAPERSGTRFPKQLEKEIDRSSFSPATLAAREYVAFEQRFRGDSEEIRDRLAGYVKQFEGRGSIAELGCGRGEFLELLRDAGLEARGVDDNAEMVSVCRERGLAVEEGDLLTYLKDLDEESMGGIFAAQVVEHLPPPVLREALTASYRALRKNGRIVLETVNTRSVVALVESFYRDLSHQKPLHPETLDFLLRSCGFRDVSIEYRSPVSERAKLLSVPSEDPNARTLNDNFRKLNAFLYGDQDYAAIAIK